jgi:hypothetical protein
MKVGTLVQVHKGGKYALGESMRLIFPLRPEIGRRFFGYDCEKPTRKLTTSVVTQVDIVEGNKYRFTTKNESMYTLEVEGGVRP